MTNDAFEAWWLLRGPAIMADPKKTVKGVARQAFSAGAEDQQRQDGINVAEYALWCETAPFSEQVVRVWNEIVTSPIPKARWSADRGKKIDARVKVLPTLEHWRVAITEMNATDWCRGEAKNSEHPNWRATFTWFVKKDDTVLRFLEAATAKRVTKAIARVPNCQHNPPCRTAEQCSEKYIEALG